MTAFLFNFLPGTFLKGENSASNGTQKVAKANLLLLAGIKLII